MLGEHLGVVLLIHGGQAGDGRGRADHEQTVVLARLVRTDLDAQVRQVGHEIAGQQIIGAGHVLVTGGDAGQQRREARVKELHPVVALQDAALLAGQLRHAIVAFGLLVRVIGSGFGVFVELGEGDDRGQHRVDRIDELLDALLYGIHVRGDGKPGLPHLVQVEGQPLDDAGNLVAVGFQIHGPVVHGVDGVGGFLDAPVVGLRHLPRDARPRQRAVAHPQRVLRGGIEGRAPAGHVRARNDLFLTVGIRVYQLRRHAFTGQRLDDIRQGGTTGKGERLLRAVVGPVGVFQIRRLLQGGVGRVGR